MTGRDPYCVWNDLDDNFVPIEGGERVPPPYSLRHRAVLGAFGVYSFKMRVRLAGGKFEGDDERAREAQNKMRERAR